MKLAAAIEHIERGLRQMAEAYQGVLFDEVAIVGVPGSGGIVLHHYAGPRRDAFLADFSRKTALVRRTLVTEAASHAGQFGFTREAEGDCFDAYICLGPGLYLFCNNTRHSMEEITQNPRWLAAQKGFLNLSQAFARDELESVASGQSQPA